MQAALQGMLDAVLRARRGPWLHPESSPAQKTDMGQPAEPRLREQVVRHSRWQHQWALTAQCDRACYG